MSNQREIEAALERAQGSPEEERKAVIAAWEQMGDWHGRCRKCGETLRGTPRQLREHVCEGPKA